MAWHDFSGSCKELVMRCLVNAASRTGGTDLRADGGSRAEDRHRINSTVFVFALTFVLVDRAPDRGSSNRKDFGPSSISTSIVAGIRILKRFAMKKLRSKCKFVIAAFPSWP